MIWIFVGIGASDIISQLVISSITLNQRIVAMMIGCIITGYIAYKIIKSMEK